MVANQGLFIVSIILGSSAFSAILSMMSAISIHAKNSSTLVAILSIPLLEELLGNGFNNEDISI